MQETLYTGQWKNGTAKKAPWDLTQFHTPSAAPLYFPVSHRRAAVSSLSKVILVLGKAINCRAKNLGCRGAESPGWFDVSPKKSAWDLMQEWVRCCDEVANHRLPTAVAFGIIGIVSAEGCSSLSKTSCRFIAQLTQSFWMWWLQNKHAHTRASTTPKWLAQWSGHCSHTRIPVHFPWLPGYMDVIQNILIILT